MSGDGWKTRLHKAAVDFRRADRDLRSNENKRRAYEDMGWPSAMEVANDAYIEALAKWRTDLKGVMGEVMAERHEYAEWINAVPGLGFDSMGLVTGLMPYTPEDTYTVSAAWRCAGLHVADGRAPKRQAGTFLGFDVELRAYWLYRVGKVAAEMRSPGDNPYRVTYDERKEHTVETHPPMLGEGEGCEYCDLAYSKTRQKREASHQTRERQSVAMDCCNVGGRHWSDGHRRADALRVATKEIIKDWWRVGNGQEPHALHSLPDNHFSVEREAATHA